MFTQKPWIVEKPFNEPHLYVSGPSTELVACLKDNYQNQKDNAKLISKAPELREATRALLTILSMYPEIYKNHWQEFEIYTSLVMETSPSERERSKP